MVALLAPPRVVAGADPSRKAGDAGQRRAAATGSGEPQEQRSISSGGSPPERLAQSALRSCRGALSVCKALCGGASMPAACCRRVLLCSSSSSDASCHAAPGGVVSKVEHRHPLAVDDRQRGCGMQGQAWGQGGSQPAQAAVLASAAHSCICSRQGWPRSRHALDAAQPPVVLRSKCAASAPTLEPVVQRLLVRDDERRPAGAGASVRVRVRARAGAWPGFPRLPQGLAVHSEDGSGAQRTALHSHAVPGTDAWGPSRCSGARHARVQLSRPPGAGTPLQAAATLSVSEESRGGQRHTLESVAPQGWFRV